MRSVPRRLAVWRSLANRRREDRRRSAAARAQNAALIARGTDLGSPGWFIATESRYAPVRDRGPAANSPLSPKRRLTNSGGDKMGFDRNAYAELYSAILERWIGSSPTLVELGIFQGSSLAMWCDLVPDGLVIGLDVSLDAFEANLPRLVRRGAFARNAPTVRVFDAFAPDRAILESVLDGRKIDVFIDDGPHDEAPSCLTAAAVRPLLADRFTYIVEDKDVVYECLHSIFAGCEIKDAGHGLVVITEG